jgi:glycosyltransferase involved in cell wall biosynthesis/ADP-heptose:LPS heptosyltransferase
VNDLILKCEGSAAESVLLTATVRDIQQSLPGMFRIDVRTPFLEIWENNPHLTSLDDRNSDVVRIQCRNRLVHKSNESPMHGIQAYSSYLNEKLGIQIKVTAFKPDIHLAASEQDARSIAVLISDPGKPWWLVNAGTTPEHTVKQWKHYQAVVDHYRDKIQFVQIGRAEDRHPPLENVIDLRGKTSLRTLICLVYHANGVLTSPGLLSHLAGGLGSAGDKSRPCVVVAGGRQPAHWTAYPGQLYLSSVGMLPCCDRGGCWRSRVISLGDGKPEDDPHQLCLKVVEESPACLDLIGAQEVISKIDAFTAAREKFPRAVTGSSPQSLASVPGNGADVHEDPLTVENAPAAVEEFIRKIRPYPGGYTGRGIVVCAGGVRLLANAWVCIKMLRHLGCQLPVQLWHLGPEELDDQAKFLFEALGVETRDAFKLRSERPARRLGGWELKPYAILNSSFKEVLLIDADNVPVENPEFLFATAPYRNTGAIFWPDFGHLKPDAPIWRLCGVPYREEPEWESGQIVVDKEKCWEALQLAMWYNENSDFYYRYILGDKETFHLAFAKLKVPFSMPAHPVRALKGTLCQHDFDGRRIFQHRLSMKWRLFDENEAVPGFAYEKECLQFLAELREKWGPPHQLIARLVPDVKSARARRKIAELIENQYDYIRVGHDWRRMTFSVLGNIETGAAGCEKYWDLKDEDGRLVLEIRGDDHVTCRMVEDENGRWQGRWLYFEKMPVTLQQVASPAGLSEFPRRWRHTRATRRKTIVFRATLNGYTGYGLLATQIVQDLIRLGYDVHIRAHNLNETYGMIPPDVRKHIVCQEVNDEWELVLAPPRGFAPRPDRRSVVFTMWESTRIEPEAVQLLNEAYQIIVPSHWNASCFSACGVHRPIQVVPLGVKADIFKYVPMDLAGPCVFGAGGRLESGGMRKGLDQVIAAFQQAFPNEPNVRLHIKTFPDGNVSPLSDQRIQVTSQYLTEEELAAWFTGLTCFVSCSHGEGWGLMPHQALAVGRPVLSAIYGGVAEYLNEEMGYPLDFQLAPARGFYAGLGLWAECDPASLVSRMRRVFENRQEAADKGRYGSQSVSKLTWERSSELLVKTMRNIGMIT